MQAQWRKRQTSTDTASSTGAPSEFSSRFGALASQVLWSRGFRDTASADAFLNPKLDQIDSPFVLRDMSGASERLALAINNNERIAVYADYDMDGTSGMALLVSFFKSCGAQEVIAYQPDRLTDGYGVHPAAIDALADKGAKVIVTVDTGISALEAALVAKKRNIDFIISDHHQQIGTLPEALFTVNPNQTLDTSGLSFLSGAGVAFYLAMAVRAKLREKNYFKNTQTEEPDLRRWLDLFVLGTVADIVELKGCNRILTKAGLARISKTERPGLFTLLSSVLDLNNPISSRDVGFSVTPKLNAASRMGQGHLAAELLLTESPSRAREIVEQLLLLNSQRSAIQQEIFSEALDQANELIAKHNPPILALHGHWHEGVLGVVASKVTETFSRPAIICGVLEDQQTLRGSMRSRAPFSCIRALEPCRELLIRFGGHSMAAGLQLKKELWSAFCDRLWSSANHFLSSLDSGDIKTAIEFDGDLGPLDQCTLDPKSVLELEDISPWGPGNPEPLFLLKNIACSQFSLLKGTHIKLKTSAGVEMIGFHKASEIQRYKDANHERIDALVVPELNRFRGQLKVQLRIEHVRGHEN